MTTAPLERRQQSKQTPSAGIPGGNKSGTGMFGWLSALSIWYFRVLSIWREESKGRGLCVGGEEGQMCGDTELGTAGLAEEHKEGKALGSAELSWQVSLTEPLQTVT